MNVIPYTKQKITFRWLIQLKWITIHCGWIAYVYTLHFTWSGCGWWWWIVRRNFPSKKKYSIFTVQSLSLRSETHWYQYRFYAMHNLLKCHVSHWAQKFIYWHNKWSNFVFQAETFIIGSHSFFRRLHLPKYSPWKMHNLQCDNENIAHIPSHFQNQYIRSK